MADAEAVETDPKEIVGKLCPECGEDFPTAMKLGYHRRVAHNIQGKYHGQGKKGAGPARPVVIETIKSMADEAGAGKRSGAPNENELTRAFARGIGGVSYAAASYAVETDPSLPTDALKEQTVTYLSLSPRAAADIAEPLGRAFARSPLNKRYGRAVVDNVDVVGSVAELTILAMHWRSYLAHRAQWEREQRGQQPWVVPDQPIVPPMQNGQTPPPTQGKVLTKEDVDRMRAN